MIVIGIDIGVTGAVAAVDSRSSTVLDLPTVAIEGQRVVRRKVCVLGLRDQLRGPVPAGEAALASLEDVHRGMGPGAAARSSLDLNRGRIEAVLELLRVPVRAVAPRVWKRHFGLGKEKADALKVARTLYPLQAHALARAKDHNRAEALLMAHFGLAVEA